MSLNDQTNLVAIAKARVADDLAGLDAGMPTFYDLNSYDLEALEEVWVINYGPVPDVSAPDSNTKIPA